MTTSDSLLFPPVPTMPRYHVHTTMWVVVLVLLALSTAICVYFLYLVLTPVRVIHLAEVPLRVINANHEVNRGSGLVYRVDYCKYVDTTATMTRELVAQDGRELLVMLPLTAGSLPVGCHAVTLVDAIPTYVPSGKYTLRITRVYRTSTFYDRPAVFETEPFFVR